MSMTLRPLFHERSTVRLLSSSIVDLGLASHYVIDVFLEVREALDYRLDSVADRRGS